MKPIYCAGAVALAIAALAVGCDRSDSTTRGGVSQTGVDAGYGTPPGVADAGGVPNPMPGSPIADAGSPLPTFTPTPPMPPGGGGTPTPGSPTSPPHY